MSQRSLTCEFPVVLASASPRRAELARSLFESFEVVPALIDEELPPTGDALQLAIALAEAKADAVRALRPKALVLAGDTIVAAPGRGEDRLLSKPVDAAEAMRMLRLLSGRTHVVATGVAMRWPKGAHSFVDVSRVTFRELGRREIEEYVQTGEPLDKAGGYGVQGLGGAFIVSIEGSRSNVMGLPVEAIRTEWRRLFGA